MGNGAKRNTKLIAAREQRNWTQAVVAEKIGVSRVAYARWEEQGIIPRLWAIDHACEVFNMSPEQLGLREYTSRAMAGVGTASLIPASPARLVSGGVGTNASADMLKVGVSALILAWRMYGCTLEELQTLVAHEMRGIDDMAHKQNDITRRDLLSFLIGLPAAVAGLTLGGDTVPLPAEEVLPLYVTAIPACWRLYYEGELEEVARVLPSYITQLTSLTHQGSRYQKPAASLLSQAHQLASLVVLEHEDFGASLTHCKQALAYGELVSDPNIQLGAYIRRANTLYYRKRYSQQLQNYQEALQTVDIKGASPLIQGRVYSGFAGILCKFGQKQEALRYEGLARDVFPDNPEDDPSYVFTHATHYIINLNAMVVHLDLGNPKAALDAITQAAKFVPNTVNPRRIELINHQGLVARSMNELEQCCSYIEEAVTLGRSLGSDLYISDARDIIDGMSDHWKSERRVKDLVDMLNT